MPRTKKTTTALSSRSESFTIYVDKVNQNSRQRSSGRESKKRGSCLENLQESPARSTGGGEKKKGLYSRTSNQIVSGIETADMKAKKVDKTKQPRKRTQPTASSSRANKSKRQDDDDQYTERTVSALATARWKPLGKASKQYVLDTLDEAIVNVLNETSGHNYDDVQDSLNILRQRIVGSLSTVTVPTIRQPDYKHMEEQCHLIEVSVAETSNQVELLEQEIEEQERFIEEKERLIEEMKSSSGQANNRRMVHTILQNSNPNTLSLPALKGPKPGSKKVASFKSSSNQHHKKLVDVLKKWQAQDSVKDIGSFMDTLSNVTSELK